MLQGSKYYLDKMFLHMLSIDDIWRINFEKRYGDHMIKKITYVSLIYLFLLATILPFTVQAADERVGYSVKATIPENQIDIKKTYFDLRMDPEQEQELEVIIYNNESEDITIQVGVHNASTNSNGLIVYEEREEIDPSLKVPLTEILTVEQKEVNIPAGESKIVTAVLQMPIEEYDGIILGGLHFEKIIKEEEDSQGISLENKYAYVIGVQLSENDREVLPALDLKSISPELVNYRTALIVNLQNSEPVIISNLTIDAQVYKQGETEAIHGKSQKQVNIAPQSNMNVVIDWKNKPLDPGEYMLEMKATDGSETWEWEETFVIEKEAAKQLNEGAVELEEDQLNMWFVVGIILLIMIILALLFYIRRLKSKLERDDDSNDREELT